MENKPIRTTSRAGYQGSRRGSALFYLALSICYAAGIYWLSSIPGNIDPEEAGIYWLISWTPPTLQNLLHIPLFGILAWLWWRSLRGWIQQNRVLLLSAFLLTAGYGMADEWHQLQVPGRYASLTDMLLNAVGALIGIWLIHRSGRTRRRPREL